MAEQNPLSAQAKRLIQKPIKEDLHLFMLKHPDVYAQWKLDGRRVLAENDRQGHFFLITPHNGVYTKSDYPEIFEKVAVVDGTILDCELLPDKQSLNIFDALWVDGEDIRQLPLSLRLLRLVGAVVKIGGNSRILGGITTRNEGEVQAYYDKALEEGYEGLVVKDLHAPYGASGSWLKMKHFDTIDVFVAGTYVTEKGNIGYNMSVFDGDGSVHPIGDVYSAVEEVDRDKIKVGTVLEVSYQPSSGFSALRHPTIERIRPDKSPDECLLSQFKN